MLYRKLKRTWSYNDIHYIPMFKETFPELKIEIKVPKLLL